MKKLILTVALFLLPLLAPALAEAQQTICTRIGDMITCNTPSTPYGQPSGSVGGALNGFVDTYLRMQESQPPVIIIQPPAQAPAPELSVEDRSRYRTDDQVKKDVEASCRAHGEDRLPWSQQSWWCRR
jgi:hypothetical protein